MALAVLMVMTLFTAFPTFAAFADEEAASFTKDFAPDAEAGDELAKLNVTAPSEVKVDEEFEMVLTFGEIKYSTLNEAPGSVDVYFNIDTRYVVFTGVKSIDGIEDLAANVSDASTGPAEKATEDYMKEVKVAVSLETDEARTAVAEKLVIHVGFKAVAAGKADAAVMTYAALGGYPEGACYTVFVDDGNPKNVEFGWAVNVAEDVPEKAPVLDSDLIPLKNIADRAEYKGTGITNGTTSKYCGEANWQEYHTGGKLNDGILSTLPTDADENDPDDTPTLERNPNVEIYYNAAFAGGVVYVYFKFEESHIIKQVKIHTNDRRNSSKRGQPNYINAYVGDSEDISSATLLGSGISDNADPYVQTWTVDGAAAEGTYVILEMEIDFTLIMIALHEVEIMSYDLDGAKNLAPDGQYKGTYISNGSDAKPDYGETGDTTYHNGRLNDGYISKDASNVETGKSLEMYYNSGFSAGTMYVYFKFDKEVVVNGANVYANSRTTGGNRGYPNPVKVYVGANEDDHNENTLIGEALTTDEGYVRNYTVTGAPKQGQYVIIEVTIPSGVAVVALTEIEILGFDGEAGPVEPEEPEPEYMNQAPFAAYKGTGGTNYSFGEDGWADYHSGKLNDKVIPAGGAYDQTAYKAENIEIWTSEDGFGAGTVYIYFKLENEATKVTEINVYANNRDANLRDYPTAMKAYVGNEENVETATLLGELTAEESTTTVKKYTASGELTGAYVIIEVELPAGIVALSEVEIMGYGHVDTQSGLEPLASPVLTGNLKNMSTYENPTVTWEAVPGALSYNVYVNGALVKEGLTETTYTTELTPGIDFNKATDYTKLQVEAVADGVANRNSELSESYNFFLVEKPVDLRGQPVTSADVIIDPGHGGTDSGATNGDRYEKTDALNMSLKVGEILESLGYTVAFTKITDMTHPLMSRAAKANAGDFKASLVIHRNSFGNPAVGGIEVLHYPNDDLDIALSQKILDELMSLKDADGKTLFNNRGLKERGDLSLTTNTRYDIPLAYVELSFISSPTDNENFDNYFNDVALAIARGTIEQIGGKVDCTGTATVNGSEVALGAADASAKVELEAGDAAKFDVAVKLADGMGFSGLQYSEDGETWQDVDISSLVSDSTIEGYKKEINYTYSADFTGKEPGDYTLYFKVKHATDTKIFEAEHNVLTVNVTVKDAEVKVDLGDADCDGDVDNVDAAAVLKHDADIAELTAQGLLNANVNKDEAVDNLDAVQILKYDAGLIENFGE